MTNISCITITTLVVVSLANLILLVTVILARKHCEEDSSSLAPFEVPEKFNYYSAESRLLTLVEDQNQHLMAALSALKDKKMMLVCGTTIISKFWVLTTAKCCAMVQSYELHSLKITSSSVRWKSGGKTHKIDKIIMHERYSPMTSTHNICLIKVESPFNDFPVSVAGSRYPYVANTSANTMGWSDRQSNQQLFNIEVKLVTHDFCKQLYHNLQIDNSMVCGRVVDGKESCNYDSGGPLLQRNVVIGLVSFETKCVRGFFPRVFTRVAFFENWFRQLEKSQRIKLGIKFNN